MSLTLSFMDAPPDPKFSVQYFPDLPSPICVWLPSMLRWWPLELYQPQNEAVPVSVPTSMFSLTPPP